MDPDSVRKENERRYFEENWSSGTRQPAQKFYSITERSKLHYADLLMKECSGNRFLELGCGPGSHAFELGRSGAEVVGIDLSPKAIELATGTAAARGVDQRVRFHVGDAENTGYPNASFDTVCGTGILHHLDLAAGMREMVRVLKPGGRGVFYEPLRHNFFINLYRKLTPRLRSPDERALTRDEISIARRYFETVDLTFFHLFGLAAIPFRNSSLFGPVLRSLDALDARLFDSVPAARFQAWVVVLELSGPRTPTQASS